MNIAVNLLPFTQNLAGAGKYAKYVTENLIRADSQNIYFLFMTESCRQHFLGIINAPNVQVVLCRFENKNVIKRIFWEQFMLPTQLQKHGIDILFTPSVAIPVAYNGVKLTSIHDVAYISQSSKYPFLRRAYVRWITAKAARKSDKILTLTEFSKSEIEKYLFVPKDNISVTYCGVEDAFYQPISVSTYGTVKEKYLLPDEYILYVGAIEPGKNLSAIFNIFERICNSSKNRLQLVMTAGIGWKQELILQQIPVTIKDRIRFLPYLEESELPVLYRLSRLVIYVSFYEGFGLPVLEAMASGVPVVASRGTSITEFASGVALLVDPLNEDEIFRSVDALLLNSELRNDLIRKGIERAKQYTWEKTAKTVLQVIRVCETLSTIKKNKNNK
ncbi:MAG: glycosyltransferase family 1 protein [Bacteroidota bacterium]